MQRKRTLEDNIRKQRNLLKSMNNLAVLAANVKASYKVNRAYRDLLHNTYKHYKRVGEVIKKQINEKVCANIRWFRVEDKNHGRIPENIN